MGQIRVSVLYQTHLMGYTHQGSLLPSSDSRHLFSAGLHVFLSLCTEHMHTQGDTGKAGPQELKTSLDFVGAKSLAWESQVLVPPLTPICCVWERQVMHSSSSTVGWIGSWLAVEGSYGIARHRAALSWSRLLIRSCGGYERVGNRWWWWWWGTHSSL